jgi:hypothetical protein
MLRMWCVVGGFLQDLMGRGEEGVEEGTEDWREKNRREVVGEPLGGQKRCDNGEHLVLTTTPPQKKGPVFRMHARAAGDAFPPSVTWCRPSPSRRPALSTSLPCSSAVEGSKRTPFGQQRCLTALSISGAHTAWATRLRSPSRSRGDQRPSPFLAQPRWAHPNANP